MNIDYQDWYTVDSGIYVSIHNNSRMPLMGTEGFTVSTNEATNVGVNRNFYYKLGYPYSECRKNVDTPLATDSDYFKNSLKVNAYSQQLCFDICFDSEYVLPNCNCSDPSISYRSDKDKSRICWQRSQLRCIRQQRAKLEVTPLSEKCEKYCPKECDTIEYSTSVTNSAYPTEYYKKILQQQDILKSRFFIRYPFTPFYLDFGDYGQDYEEYDNLCKQN
jgi:hypothetical protein